MGWGEVKVEDQVGVMGMEEEMEEEESQDLDWEEGRGEGMEGDPEEDQGVGWEVGSEGDQEAGNREEDLVVAWWEEEAWVGEEEGG